VKYIKTQPNKNYNRNQQQDKPCDNLFSRNLHLKVFLVLMA